MLDIQSNTSFLIKDKYNEIKNFYVNKDSDNIYDFTPHALRYNTLKYTLKIASLPFAMLSQAIKFVTLGSVSLKHFNLFNIFLEKMDRSIYKKISYGLPEENENDQAIPKIVEQILKKYEEQPELIAEPELFPIKKFVTKIGEYIPGFSKFLNFWNCGGVNYSDEIQVKQPIIDFIYKKIISSAYNAGKKGEKLEINDIQKLFAEVDFNEKVEAIDLVQENKEVIEVTNEEYSEKKILPTLKDLEQEHSALNISEKHNEEFNDKNFIPSNFSIKPVIPQILCFVIEQMQEQWVIEDYYENINNNVSIIPSFPLEPYKYSSSIMGYNPELIAYY